MDLEQLNVDKKLILMVQNHKYLYDKRELLYKNNTVKENAWIVIANELNTTTDFVKKRWDNLRDRFVRAYREFTSPLPSEYTDPNKSKKYKDFPYYEIMDWLTPYIRKRKVVYTKSNNSFTSYNPEDETFADELSIPDDGVEFDGELEIKMEPLEEHPSPKKRRLEEEFNGIVAQSSINTKKNSSINDNSKTADEYFMRSIALDMEMLPRDLKIQFKLEVLKLLQTYVSKS